MAVDPRSSTAAPAGGGSAGPEVGAAPVARSPRRRGDSGLTTLEWLLIVAAVAGLAALAVVLVQNVVSDTSEQIAGSSARVTAARVAGQQVMLEAEADDDRATSGDTWDDWSSRYSAKCLRIGITYADAGVAVQAWFTYQGAPVVGDVSTFGVTQASQATVAGAAHAHCMVQ